MCGNDDNLTPPTVGWWTKTVECIYCDMSVGCGASVELIQGCLHTGPFILDRRPVLVFPALKASAEEVWVPSLYITACSLLKYDKPDNVRPASSPSARPPLCMTSTFTFYLATSEKDTALLKRTCPSYNCIQAHMAYEGDSWALLYMRVHVCIQCWFTHIFTMYVHVQALAFPCQLTVSLCGAINPVGYACR